LTSYEARIVDAGPDAIPGSCFSDPGCVECDPVSPASCPSCDGGTCPGCDGGDCDPLPAGRDPWPAVCNELELAEGFSKTPKEGWGRSYNDLFIKVESCGLLQWSCPPHHTIWAWLSDELASGLSSDALVETRIFPRWRGSWTYTLGVNVTAEESNMGWPETQGRSCALEHDGDRGIRLSNRVITSAGSQHESVYDLKVGGTTLVLQSWKEGHKHHCRLLPGSGKPVVIESEIEGTMSKQGTIKLALVNQDVTAPYVWFWIDYLRVYSRQ
jgi:hypothetical protein